MEEAVVQLDPDTWSPQTMRKVLPWIYLALAVLGAVLPWRANLSSSLKAAVRPLICRASSPMPPAQQPPAP